MEKFILIAIAVLILNGCATTKLKFIPAEEYFVGIDFRPYTEQGFLFTPEKYLDEYESIGLVDLVSIPEANYVPLQQFSDGSTLSKWQINEININDVLRKYYEMAIEMGADGIMNFRLEKVTRRYTIGVESPITIEGISISGFAIKRK